MLLFVCLIIRSLNCLLVCSVVCLFVCLYILGVFIVLCSCLCHFNMELILELYRENGRVRFGFSTRSFTGLYQTRCVRGRKVVVVVCLFDYSFT